MAGCSSRNASLRCVSCTSRTTRGMISPCSSPPCRGCRSPPSGCCADASGRTSSCPNSSRPSAWPAASSTCSTTCISKKQSAPSGFNSMARTRTQMFSGAANWDEIARVVEALDIPVIGNGDITTAQDVIAMRAHTNCAGVMIARGSFGNPWIFTQARDLVAGRPGRPDPSPDERVAIALEHARLALRLQGDTRKTALEFRKHFGWYTKGVAGAVGLRDRLFQIESMQQAEAIFAAYLAGSAVEQAA